MKAIVVDGDGKAADSLRIAEAPDPVAGDEEVLLRVHASCVATHACGLLFLLICQIRVEVLDGVDRAEKELGRCSARWLFP